MESDSEETWGRQRRGLTAESALYRHASRPPARPADAGWFLQASREASVEPSLGVQEREHSKKVEWNGRAEGGGGGEKAD